MGLCSQTFALQAALLKSMENLERISPLVSSYSNGAKLEPDTESKCTWTPRNCRSRCELSEGLVPMWLLSSDRTTPGFQAPKLWGNRVWKRLGEMSLTELSKFCLHYAHSVPYLRSMCLVNSDISKSSVFVVSHAVNLFCLPQTVVPTAFILLHWHPLLHLSEFKCVLTPQTLSKVPSVHLCPTTN